jgi:hypothetical protein
MALTINAGVTIEPGVTLNGFAPGGGVSIDPTFIPAPYVTNYNSGTKELALWYTSTSDAQYIAAAGADTGQVVSFVQSSTEYRGVVSSVAISTNSIYGPTAYVVTITFSAAASGYALPTVNGSPDRSPVNLI